MDSAVIPFDSFNDSGNDDGYLFDLLSQQSSASAFTNDAANEADGLYMANGDMTSAEASFGACHVPPAGMTFFDYLLTQLGTDVANNFDLDLMQFEGSWNPTPGLDQPQGLNQPHGLNQFQDLNTFQGPQGAPSFEAPAGNALAISNINAPDGHSTFNFAAEGANVNVPPTFNLATGNAGINMSINPQAIIEQPSSLGFGNGGFLNGTNVGDQTVNGAWVGTSHQQVHQPIIGVHAPSTTQHNGSSNTSSETRSPPKRSRSSSPPARPAAIRQRPRPIRFIHDERSMPANFRANPDNHGRFQYTATGRRRYLNGPEAVQERRRRRRQAHA